MSLFKEILSSEETIFKNENALDFDFIPKILPFREKEQKEIAFSISPLINGRDGRNLFIHGNPGIGKTAASKFVLRDLENETEDILIIYINCWQKNTSFKVIQEACHRLGYKLTHNKKTDELMKVLAGMINKKSAVIILDEVDKLDDNNVLYMFLEDLYKKSLISITNFESWISNLDKRIRSRFNPQILKFKSYNYDETFRILSERAKYAFFENVISEQLIELISKKSFQLKDIRSGIYLLKQAGLNAEARSSRTINDKDVNKAILNIREFSTKNKEILQDEEKLLLSIIKENSGLKMGELFVLYQEQGGKGVYKTFQRLIEQLDSNRFITTNKMSFGKKGNTKIVKYSGLKKLSDY